jgi:DNA repair exonuclease SbcCD ATPase subunit
MGDIAGANVVAETLDMHRWEDHWRRVREQNGLMQQNGIPRHEIAWLEATYDDLIARYNALAQTAMQAVHDAEQRVADLERELRELRAAKADSDAQLRELAALEAGRILRGEA